MKRFLSDSEVLLKAAMNRIAARVTEKLKNSAQEFSELTEDLPQRLQDEWSSFKEEIIRESERIEKNKNSAEETNSKQQSNKEDMIQAQIDNLRSKVIEINKNIEEKN